MRIKLPVVPLTFEKWVCLFLSVLPFLQQNFFFRFPISFDDLCRVERKGGLHGQEMMSENGKESVRTKRKWNEARATWSKLQNRWENKISRYDSPKWKNKHWKKWEKEGWKRIATREYAITARYSRRQKSTEKWPTTKLAQRRLHADVGQKCLFIIVIFYFLENLPMSSPWTERLESVIYNNL